MGLLQACDEPVDLLGDGVEVEAGPVRRRDAKLGHQRLAAVVAGTNRDAVHVEDLCHVVRVDPFDVERDDSRTPVGGRAVADEARYVGQTVERVDEQLTLVLLDRTDAHVAHVVDRSSEPYGLRDRLRAGLELVGKLAPGRLLERDRADHVAAQAASRSTGLIVPSAFETRLLATTLTFPSRAISSSVSKRSSPCSSSGIAAKVAPLRLAMYCQGTKFEWCSSSVTTATSPGPRLSRPHA